MMNSGVEAWLDRSTMQEIDFVEDDTVGRDSMHAVLQVTSVISCT